MIYTKFMKNTFLPILIFFCSVLISCSSQTGTADEQKNKILIVADEWAQMHSLAQYLGKTGKYKIDSVNQENIQLELLEYDHIFMYIHSKLAKNAEVGLIGYVKNGGKLIVLHHGIASSKMNNPDWLEFVGIQLYPPYDEDYPWKVLHDTTHTMVNLSPSHFITSNRITYTRIIDFTTDYSDSISGEYPAFDLTNTEVFLNQRFTPSKNKKLLYGFATGDGSIMQPTSGWYQRTGKGWLFYFQAGHKLSDFENKNFRQILLNTLEWQPIL